MAVHPTVAAAAALTPGVDEHDATLRCIGRAEFVLCDLRRDVVVLRGNLRATDDAWGNKGARAQNEQRTRTDGQPQTVRVTITS